MSRFGARILDGPHLFVRDQVTLAVVDRDTGDYLAADGTWKRGTEGARAEDMGIVIPSAAVEALATAIQEFQGHTSHADTEARVLREWLAVEQRRVDSFLANPSSDTR